MTRRRSFPWSALILAVALAALVVGAWFDAKAAAAGWLAAFLFVAGVPVGAVSVILIGRLTGGEWFLTLEPALRRLARLVPLAGIAIIPLIAASPVLYPWVHGAHDPDVGFFYLNMPLVVARAVVAFVGWTLLAYDFLPVGGRNGQITAGLGLVFHIVMTTFLSYDWILALSPGFTSSAFGTETIIIWLMSALAAAMLLCPAASTKATADVAGLFIATILGTAYMVFMQFLIIWYGDQPDTARLYLDRYNATGLSFLVAALVIGVILPLAVLADERARAGTGWVQGVAALLLAGVALYRGWLALAPFDGLAIVMATVALVALIAAFRLAWRRAERAAAVPRRVSHGR